MKQKLYRVNNQTIPAPLVRNRLRFLRSLRFQFLCICICCGFHSVGRAQSAAVIGNAGYTNCLVVATKPAKLYAVTGYNSGPAQFIQVFETNAPPVTGATPVFSIPVASQQYFDLDFSYYGADLDGIIVCNSTSANSLAPGGINCGIQAIVRH